MTKPKFCHGGNSKLDEMGHNKKMYKIWVRPERFLKSCWFSETKKISLKMIKKIHNFTPKFARRINNKTSQNSILFSVFFVYFFTFHIFVFFCPLQKASSLLNLKWKFIRVTRETQFWWWKVHGGKLKSHTLENYQEKFTIFARHEGMRLKMTQFFRQIFYQTFSVATTNETHVAGCSRPSPKQRL